MTTITKTVSTCFDTAIRPVILDASGLALIAVGAFQVGPILGFPVAGIACIALQWRLRG